MDKSKAKGVLDLLSRQVMERAKMLCKAEEERSAKAYKTTMEKIRLMPLNRVVLLEKESGHPEFTPRIKKMLAATKYNRYDNANIYFTDFSVCVPKSHAAPFTTLQAKLSDLEMQLLLADDGRARTLVAEVTKAIQKLK